MSVTTDQIIAHEPITPILAKALARHDQERAQLMDLNGVATVAEGAAARLCEAGIHAYTYMSGSNYAAWLVVEFKAIDDIALARRMLASAGFTLSHKSDFPDDKYFTVDHTKDGVPGRIILCCRMHDSGEGSTCRYVQTGMKQTPVYELKCEGVAS